jgi:hypothetical protein
MKIKNVIINEIDDNASDSNEVDGTGPYCCGTRMVLAPSEIVYECLECGQWWYTSS